MIIANGSADVTTYWVLRDSTTHAPKTSVTITDIDVYYVEQGAAISAKADLTALAAADSAHADNKGYEIGQGLYRIDWPDAAFDGGVGKHVILIVVCSGVDTTFLDVELSPAVNAAALGGTTCTGRDIGASVLLSSGTGTGQVSLSSGTVSLTADQAVNVTKWGGTAVASAYVQANTAQFAGQTITCAGGVTIPAATLASTTGAVGSVTAGVTLANGAHGGASASLTLGAGASISNASGSALTLSSSGGNGSGLVCTGNGTGKGIAATGGASGAGIAAVGGATANGYGIYAEANSADCYGLQAVGKGATESGGIKGTATTSGEGIEGLAAGNGHGLYVVGAGTGEGIHATAGGGANAHGAHFEGVGANSHGLFLSRGGSGGDDLKFANNDVTVATVTSVTGIGTGGITAGSFAAGAIDAAAIATGAIDADAIADNAIDAAALASDVATEIATGILDLADGIETGYTLRQAQRVQLAAAAGKLSGAETTTVAIRNVTDAKTRITATVDADGNRSAVTLDAT